jgi:phosphoribosylaminoimidazolecarboxamide formyltransferase/IMP cyclohydrolase
MNRKINSALISVFHKEGLEDLVKHLHSNGVSIYSTGGTEKYINSLGVPVLKVEDQTGFPSILDGRVKTLHPAVFGGILARREEDHLSQLKQYDLPQIDMVVVDLYPFEDTVRSTDEESAIIEKIDIGGISLIRAAAKNYKDVVIVPSKKEYPMVIDMLGDGVETTIEQRKLLARRAFGVSAAYDNAILGYFKTDELSYQPAYPDHLPLRYGENPHQFAGFHGPLDCVNKLSGKELSYNNLVDVDAAISLMKEFKSDDPTFAILKHTNACGVATRSTVLGAWEAALAGDPISAFGGILISNSIIDLDTAQEIDKIFYEVVIAPSFTDQARELLMKKKKRILLELKHYPESSWQFKSLLDGVIAQSPDEATETSDQFEVITERAPSPEEIADLVFANKCVKHLKSNTIVLVKDNQLLGMGCGQTSRVDACRQAIEKAGNMGFSLEGAVMASDAFFPFPDCVELGADAGVTAVIQPGGSINDKLSIEMCNEKGMSMVKTGVRHFKH